MVALSNSPKTQTVFTLEARTSYAFGVKFLSAKTGEPIDLTGSQLRLMASKPRRYGGDNAIVLTAEPIGDPALGLQQFALQDSHLDQPAGEYPFSVTLVSALGYSTPILKGTINIVPNADEGFLRDYPVISPTTNLAAYLDDGDLVEVKVDSVDGLAMVVNGYLNSIQDEIEVAHALSLDVQSYRTESEAFAIAAEASATIADTNADAAAGSAQVASDSASTTLTRQQLAQNAANTAANAAATALAYLLGIGSATTAAQAAAAAAQAAQAAAEAAVDEINAGDFDIQALVDHGSFNLDGEWDFTAAVVTGLAGGGGPAVEGTQFLNLDIDGVPFYDAGATVPSLALLLDFDNVPYYEAV